MKKIVNKLIYTKTKKGKTPPFYSYSFESNKIFNCQEKMLKITNITQTHTHTHHIQTHLQKTSNAKIAKNEGGVNGWVEC